MRGQSPRELYVSLACSTLSKVRSCFYPWERLTTERRKHDSVGKVLQRKSSTTVLFRQEAEPFIPRLKAGAFWPIFCKDETEDWEIRHRVT